MVSSSDFQLKKEVERRLQSTGPLDGSSYLRVGEHGSPLRGLREMSAEVPEDRGTSSTSSGVKGLGRCRSLRCAAAGSAVNATVVTSWSACRAGS